MRKLIVLLGAGLIALFLLTVVNQTSADDKTKPEPTKTESPKPTDEPTKVPEPTEEKHDIDEDGVADEKDNCVETPNTDQKDSDKDGIGDACDDDSDDDGLPDKDEEDKGTDPKEGDTDGDNCGDYPETKHLVDDKIATDPKDPLDFDDVTGDKKVLIGDVVGEVQNYYAEEPGIFDRTGDGEVYIADILHTIGQYSADCSKW
jgi:hypothetical protein